jgi:hypothetical protein
MARVKIPDHLLKPGPELDRFLEVTMFGEIKNPDYKIPPYTTRRQSMLSLLMECFTCLEKSFRIRYVRDSPARHVWEVVVDDPRYGGESYGRDTNFCLAAAKAIVETFEEDDDGR